MRLCHLHFQNPKINRTYGFFLLQNLRTRLFTRTLRDADRASADAAKIMDRLNRRGVTRAVSSDPDLGSLVDSLSVLMGDH